MNIIDKEDWESIYSWPGPFQYGSEGQPLKKIEMDEEQFKIASHCVLNHERLIKLAEDLIEANKLNEFNTKQDIDNLNIIEDALGKLKLK